MSLFGVLFSYAWRNNAYRPYEIHLDRKLKQHRGNRDLAYAQAIGSASVELFVEQGDAQVHLLRHYGLIDGMAVFDLGCGCGRTAQGLQRSGWTGSYLGTDVVKRFTSELVRKCPSYKAFEHRLPSIPAGDGSLDLVFHWSVFTHISTEECFLYLQDIFRALHPGGRLIFSFMEMSEPAHFSRFQDRSHAIGRGKRQNLMDTFLHRDWITAWGSRIGFTVPRFTAGSDDRAHPAFWQSLAAMEKPLGR